ncbi:stalk domain-containing protein [Cohnella yongneupensis]|uniref:Stalk domain-containing protein n=1 Tax=Cohnella yongneupensis TaxID=425006 RepID=A0ABW0R8V5_9BACL
MKPIRWFSLISLVVCIALPPGIAFAAPASSSPPAATYHFEWTDGSSLSGEAIIKNGISYVGVDAIAEAMVFSRVIWSNEHRVKFDGFRTSFTITIGKDIGAINDVPVSVGGIPFKKDNQIFVPAKFVFKALRGTKLSCDPKQHIVAATGLRKDAGARMYYSRLTFKVDYETGILTIMDNLEEIERKLADLGSPLHGIVTYNFHRTEGGLLLLKITDNYGEPHVNYQEFQVVIKNRGLIRQSRAQYYNRYANNASFYDKTIVLTDGRQLRLIEDGTGNVLEKIDLVKLGGEDDNYFVEAIDDEFLLLRANKSGMLKLYDRRTKEIVLLYKQLLDPSLFEIVENYTQPMIGAGDYLVFDKREGNTLIFRNDAPYLSEKERGVQYRYELAKP